MKSLVSDGYRSFICKAKMVCLSLLRLMEGEDGASSSRQAMRDYVRNRRLKELFGINDSGVWSRLPWFGSWQFWQHGRKEATLPRAAFPFAPGLIHPKTTLRRLTHAASLLLMMMRALQSRSLYPYPYSPLLDLQLLRETAIVHVWLLVAATRMLGGCCIVVVRHMGWKDVHL